MRIIIASGNLNFTKDLKEKLPSATVGYCSTGKDTQVMLSKESFDYIIIDSTIRNHTYPYIIKYCKTNCPSIKILLLFYSEQTLKELELEEKDLKKMGLFGYSIGPRSVDKFINIINRNSGFENWKKVDNTNFDYKEYPLSDKYFTSLSVNKFYSGNTAIFDMYIKISKNKYLKILNRGESIEKDRIKKYIDDHKLEFFYFKTEDRKAYISYMNKMAESLTSRLGKSSVKISSIVNSTVEKYIEEVYTKGIDESTLKEGVKICDNAYRLLENTPSTKKLLEKMPEESKSHHFLTTIYSIIICREIDWAGSSTMQNITQACLFHDIGLVKFNWYRENPNFRVSDLNSNQLEEYKEHPNIGYDMLREISYISEATRQIVLQHHEFINSSGFPTGLGSQKIYPLAKIVSLADFFSHRIIDDSMNPMEALRLFIPNKEETDKFHADYIKALIKGFIND